MVGTRSVLSAREAVADVPDGARIMCGGFGGAGYPTQLVQALAQRRVRDLTVISNNAGHDPLLAYGGIRRVICSYPLGASSRTFAAMVEREEVELELEPQGVLAERIRAGGAGIGGFLSPVGLGTELAEGKQVVAVEGREYLLCPPLRADFAFVRAWKADRFGNLVYRFAGRNFNQVMATAATVVIAEVSELVDGCVDPNDVHTPGVFVDRLVTRD